MKKYNCVIIGYGYMGKIRHHAINSFPQLKLKFIVDENPNIVPSSNNYKVINDYKKLTKEDVDIAFVCTPNNISANIILKFLKKKIMIFCEKPPAKNLSEVVKIKKLTNKNTKLMFGFNHRFHPAIQKAKKIIDSKKFGKVISIRGVYGKSGGINFKKSWRNVRISYSISD